MHTMTAGNRQAMDIRSMIYSEKSKAIIDKKCALKFTDENDRDQCRNFVFEAMEADNYKRFSTFTGKTERQFYNWFYAIAGNLIIDFKRQKFGRKRFPEAVKKLGEWAKAVYAYVCWHKFSYEDAYEFLKVEQLFKGSWEAFVKKIKPVTQAPCNGNPQFESSYAESGKDMIEETQTGGANPLDLLIDKLDQENKNIALERIKVHIEQLQEKDRLLVKLVYASNHKIAAAARVIGISRQKARRRLRKIELNIKEELLTQGIR